MFGVEQRYEHTRQFILQFKKKKKLNGELIEGFKF